MKASDYIVEYLIGLGVRDVFGYPGGMVTHLMDSLSKYDDQITGHVTYHEQGAAFAACGYAQASGNIGVAYATSGPGATNLITGICDAYFDSIPVLFITGQVNTFESKTGMSVRQRGFQETDIVSMAAPVTKYTCRVTDANELKRCLDYACYEAMHGRKGPVLVDIPMNIMRADINPDTLKGYEPSLESDSADISAIKDAMASSRRPVLVLGNGIKQSDAREEVLEFIDRVHVPVVSTMLAVDVAPSYSYGFIGAYGSRAANFIVAKSDLIITLGARMDVRQVGARREQFAPDAQIIRIDIDQGELGYHIRDNDINICADIKAVMRALNKEDLRYNNQEDWNQVCQYLAETLSHHDDRVPNRIMSALGSYFASDSLITTDVGQNQVWAAQSLPIQEGQRVFFSGGHGAMGYSLPAAIGCAIASGKTVYCLNGDGGIQMNIQELQTIAREHLPIKIIVMNNYALGMIRHFQEMYFDSNYYQTTSQHGYTTPDFTAIARAYVIPAKVVNNLDDINADLFCDGPELIEVRIPEDTYVYPKLEFGKPNQDQEPLISRELYRHLMEL